MRNLLCASILALGLPLAASAGTATFDSSAEFSGVQGQDGWSYGYYAAPGDAATFVQMAHFSASGLPSIGDWWSEGAAIPPYTLLWADGGHPSSSPSAHWSVRRWTSGTAGVLDVAGSYGKLDTGTVTVHVLLDGVDVWNAPTSAASAGFALQGVVGVGSEVDFVIDPHGTDPGDATRYVVTGTVSAVPEPASVAMLLAGLAGIAGVRRRRS